MEQEVVYAENGRSSVQVETDDETTLVWEAKGYVAVESKNKCTNNSKEQHHHQEQQSKRHEKQTRSLKSNKFKKNNDDNDNIKTDEPKIRRRKILFALFLFFFVVATVVGILLFVRQLQSDNSTKNQQQQQQLQNQQENNNTIDNNNSSNINNEQQQKQEEETNNGDTVQVETTNIRTFHSAYAYEEVIKVFYALNEEDEPPRLDDWIGIFPAGALLLNNNNNTNNNTTNSMNAVLEIPPVAALYLCGTPIPCTNFIDNNNPGQIRFEGGITSTTTTAADTTFAWNWPIEPGEYQAYLLRNNNNNDNTIKVLAESSQFIVEPNPFWHQTLPSLRQAEDDIRVLLVEDVTLGPKFVRLGFHDCVGGCDGCVDMTFEDNFGLDVPIEALAPIVQKYENASLHVTRADLWALAALVGADIAQERSRIKVDFSLEYIGRQNCEDRYDVCLDFNETIRDCNATLGPFIHIPEAKAGTDELFHFFSEEFQFSVQEVVALMGAHTLGSLNRENSGFDGPNGWVRDNELLDNDYYFEIVGGEADDPIERIVELAPPWGRVMFDNSDLEDMPDRFGWQAFPNALNGDGVTPIVMLNVDIALVRELNESNILPDGSVNCTFLNSFAEQAGQPRCPHAARSIEFAHEYKLDNELWLQDFEKVYKKMLHNGYDYDPTRVCRGGVCVLN